MCPDLIHFTRPRGRVPAEDIPRQLRELSSELPPPYDWAEFRRRGRNRVFSNRFHVKWPHAAAAAGLAAFVGAMAVLGTGGFERNSDSVQPRIVEIADGTGPQMPDGTSDGIRAVPRGAPGSAARTPNARQARDTREWLARQPAEPAVVRVGPRIAVANLEDRIAWFDDALTNQRLQGVNAEQVKVLQQERARLVSSLAQVRYAEALAAGGS
jgi:hypothetical protein